MVKLAVVCVVGVAMAGGAIGIDAQSTGVAATPPMGWNSWDAYGLTITESQFRDNVKVLHDKLQPYGWNYAVIDEGWFFFNPLDREKPDTLHYAIDQFGRYVPVPERFPSALKGGAAAVGMNVDRKPTEQSTHHLAVTFEDTSFKVLGDWVHAQGLKFGIHIVRGIPRASVERNLPVEGSAFHAQDVADTNDACPWDPTNWGVKDNAAGQAWYDSLLKQYASWGVDLLKVDCIADHPYAISEIRMIRRAIDKTGRPMVLSLSPGPTSLSHAEEVAKLSNMWRISNDEWDIWDSKGKEFPQGVEDQFARFAAWEKYAGPGHWPDGDMLPWGELKPVAGWQQPRSTRLTKDEETTQITLWAMARSPLILGANLTMLDGATQALLTNKDVIAIDQTSAGSAQVLDQKPLIAWRSKLKDGRMALAVFNTGDGAIRVDRKLADFDAAFAGRHYSVDEVWSRTHVGDSVDRVGVDLRPHACVLYLLR